MGPDQPTETSGWADPASLKFLIHHPGKERGQWRSAELATAPLGSNQS
jgi:hypothetical protein